MARVRHVRERLFFAHSDPTTRFWGKEQGPTVFLWESLGEEGREEGEQATRTRKDWVVGVDRDQQKETAR